MRRVFWSMIGLLALLVPVTIAGAAQAAPATPASTCTIQRCHDLLENQAQNTLNLGDSNGTAILFGNDGSPTQRWDIEELTDGNYAIYLSGNTANEALTRGGSCGVNGSTYLYCAVVEPQTTTTPPASQQWIEVGIDPFIFESDGSGTRCLTDANGVEAAGQQVVLYPCSQLTDTSQEWFAKSSE